MRKARKLKKGARYHVISRTNRREMSMQSSEIKDLFLKTIEQAKIKFEFQIYNFCIMGNHFHIIIEPLGDENLSKIMKWILGVFAQRWNKFHKTSGHFWGDRFFSRIIHSLREFLNVFRYIDRNPVQGNLCKNERDWPYGGLFHRRKGQMTIVGSLPDWLLTLIPNHKCHHL
jgi:putative transposase